MQYNSQSSLRGDSKETTNRVSDELVTSVVAVLGAFLSQGYKMDSDCERHLNNFTYMVPDFRYR